MTTSRRDYRINLAAERIAIALRPLEPDERLAALAAVSKAIADHEAGLHTKAAAE